MNEITLNQTFKNYPELCSFLDEEVLSGKQKEYQIKRWKEFFAFEKNGHKLKIIKVHKPYRKKLDEVRQSVNYPIMLTLLSELQKSYSGVRVSNSTRKKYKELVIYTSDLCCILGFCKKEFFALQDKGKDTKTSWTPQEKQQVFVAGNNIFREKIRHILETLQKYNFIFHRKHYVIATKDREELDLATDEEFLTIETIKHETLGEIHDELFESGKVKYKYGKFTEADCHILNVSDELYSKIGVKLLQRTHIIQSYSVHQIFFTDAMLNRFKEFRLDIEEQLGILDETNGKIVNRLYAVLDENLHPIVDQTVKL